MSSWPTTARAFASSACARRTAPWTSPVSLADSAAAGTGRRRVRRPSCRSTSSWRRSVRESKNSSERRSALRQACRRHLARRRRAGAAGAPEEDEGGPRGDARPVRHGAAPGPRGKGDARAAVPDGVAQDLPRGRAARLDFHDRAIRRASCRKPAESPMIPGCPRVISCSDRTRIPPSRWEGGVRTSWRGRARRPS